MRASTPPLCRDKLVCVYSGARHISKTTGSNLKSLVGCEDSNRRLLSLAHTSSNPTAAVSQHQKCFPLATRACDRRAALLLALVTGDLDGYRSRRRGIFSALPHVRRDLKPSANYGGSEAPSE